MTSTGPERLGDLARAQIAAARTDPRLGRRRGAMIADFSDAMEEAERLRTLGVFGLFALRESLEHEEYRLGIRHEDPSLDANQANELQAAWERTEMARVEIANEHPHLHAMALISMNSALDAMVEELVPAFQQMLIERRVKLSTERLEREQPELVAAIQLELLERVSAALRAQLTTHAPKIPPLKGSGTIRYERRLSHVGLGAPADRPIPDDLDIALTELGALRDVIIHRAGRVDSRALGQAPTLNYEDGEFVRIKRPEYRRYSAALRCYGAEAVRRAMLGLYDGTEHDVDLLTWRGWYWINA